MKKYYTGRYDIVFKSIFTRSDSKELLKVFIEKLLNIKIDEIKVLNNELNIDDVLEKEKTVDVLLNVEEDYLHIELNSLDKRYLHNRNFAYFSKIYGSSTRKGDEYDLETKFIHIDLTYNLLSKYKTNKVKNEYYVINEDKIKYIDNLRIIEYDMDLLRDKWYNMSNKEQEEYKYLFMLDLGKEELEKLSEKGDKVVMEYKEKVNEMNEEEWFTSLMSREEDMRKCHNTDLKYAREDGIKENQISTAKEMLKKDFDINTISEITKLSLEEINELK